ncbi:MAG: UDP-N-acetylmuramate dehydrogenase [Chloroflexota bacterium]|nr:UDP-N-acetylmuramate dehydrogenase [Chloroflexota bacterium]MDE2898633.1 UDP-N-acetylmuramate dehydrogenase [Chloroflexota bacterium]
MTSEARFPSGLRVRTQEPMARHTSFGVGGAADYWVETRTLDSLRLALESADRLNIPRTIMGHGTNTLVADAGVEGLVINNRCMDFEPSSAAGLIRVASGHSMARLAGRCARLGLGGLSFAIGVPGTVGGAVFGNAGAFGSDVASVLESALVWRPGQERESAAYEFGFAYRHSNLQGEDTNPVVLAASFRVQRSDPGALRTDLLRLARQRRATQPQGQNAGSFFMNPDGDYAGRLIETTGLKGKALGGAFVSPIHANFISARPGGTARDVLDLAIAVRARVAEATGIWLTPEVRLLGRWNSRAQALYS